jgi:hypothetical protein
VAKKVAINYHTEHSKPFWVTFACKLKHKAADDANLSLMRQETKGQLDSLRNAFGLPESREANYGYQQDAFGYPSLTSLFYLDAGPITVLEFIHLYQALTSFIAVLPKNRKAEMSLKYHCK